MGIKIMRTPRWVMACYAIILLVGIIAALPNLFTTQQLASMPSWVPKQQITLGLDLRGGAHLVLEVDEPALRLARLQSLAAEARNTLQTERVETQSRSEERRVGKEWRSWRASVGQKTTSTKLER